MRSAVKKLCILLLTLALIALFSGGAFCEEEGIPEEGTVEPVEIDLLTGNIDQVSSDMIVIDDMSYRFDGKTAYFAINGALASKSILSPGKFIGYLHEEGLLTEVRLMTPEEDEKRPERVRTGGKSSPGEVYQEGGVWKN